MTFWTALRWLLALAFALILLANWLGADLDSARNGEDENSPRPAPTIVR